MEAVKPKPCYREVATTDVSKNSVKPSSTNTTASTAKAFNTIDSNQSIDPHKRNAVTATESSTDTLQPNSSASQQEPNWSKHSTTDDQVNQQRTLDPSAADTATAIIDRESHGSEELSMQQKQLLVKYHIVVKTSNSI
jgi:hypothetical protein